MCFPLKDSRIYRNAQWESAEAFNTKWSPQFIRLVPEQDVDFARSSVSSSDLIVRNDNDDRSLPARVQHLVLTRTMHTPDRKTEDMRVLVQAGVMEHRHTMYSHLSLHARVKGMQWQSIYCRWSVYFFVWLCSQTAKRHLLTVIMQSPKAD